MSREMALMQVNSIENALAVAVRGVVEALANDGRIDLGEGVSLGSTGLMLGLQVTNLLRGLSPQAAKDLLYVLEHSERVLPPESI